jgi:hypothetical protein
VRNFVVKRFDSYFLRPLLPTFTIFLAPVATFRDMSEAALAADSVLDVTAVVALMLYTPKKIIWEM